MQRPLPSRPMPPQPPKRPSVLGGSLNSENGAHLSPSYMTFPDGYPASCVWVRDKNQMWTLGLVNDRTDTFVFVTLPVSQQQESYHIDDIFPCNPSLADDMTSLHYLHEPGILFNLAARYLNQSPQRIYTNMASALIAVNPFTRIPDSDWETSPHPNRIAETARMNLQVLGQCQSIVISGESGAGKTETAKIVIKHLSSSTSSSSSSVFASENKDLYAKLQDLSPILESFGNAKTSRNGNSSRFGKFMKLQFNQSTMMLTGATIETYLLEKSRVVPISHGSSSSSQHASSSESNYHIFYALLKAQHTSIDSRYNYRLAPHPNDVTLDNDHTLATVTQALLTLGLTQTAIDELFTIISGILYLGNISLDEENSSSQGSSVACLSTVTSEWNPGYDSNTFLQLATTSFHIAANSLKLLITQREVEAGGEKYCVPLTKREAEFARDAICKTLYEMLFRYIIIIANSSLSSSESPKTQSIEAQGEKFIGVLDIFGFESFTTNGFEQLLINCANESLQLTFNQQIFDKELQLFESEKIEFSAPHDIPSNLPCVQLLSGYAGNGSSNNKESILGILDSISRQPQPTDERFVEELHKQFTKKNISFLSVHRKDMKSLFIIQHYAMPVRYTVNSNDSPWIVKNNDSIPDALDKIIGTSKLTLLIHLLSTLNSSSSSSSSHTASSSSAVSSSAAANPTRRKSVMMKPTIAFTFTKSIHTLTETLNATQCHFIRCIKPNAQLVPHVFDQAFVVEQLRALGIVQACEVLKVSLPTRLSYTELIKAQPALQQASNKVQHLLDTIKSEDDVNTDALLIAALFQAHNVPEDAYRLGTTMAFFRPGQLATLETLLSSRSNSAQNNAANNTHIATVIEQTIISFQQVMKESKSMHNELNELLEILSEFHNRQLKLRGQLQLLPELRGLDIPENVANGVSGVEGRLSSLRQSLGEQKRNYVALIARLSSSFPDWEKDQTIEQHFHEVQQAMNECEAYIKRFESQYDTLRLTIEQLEETHANSSQGGDIARRAILDNDLLYEQAMDNVDHTEKFLESMKTDAQRALFSKVDLHKQQVANTINTIKAQSKQLETGIRQAADLLRQIESSLTEADWTGVENMLASLLDSKEQQESGRRAMQLQHLSGELDYAIREATTAMETEKKKQAEAAAAAKIKATNNNKPVADTQVKDKDIGGRRVSFQSSSNTPSIAAAASNYEGTLQKPLQPHQRSPSFTEAGTSPTNVKFNVKDLVALRRKSSMTASSADAIINGNAASITTAATVINNNEHPKKPSPPPPPPEKPKRKSTTDASVVEHLPPDWKELFDPKSSRPYYVNRVTKERTWKRPKLEESATISNNLGSNNDDTNSVASGPTRKTKQPADNDTALPSGWRMVLDKKSNRPFYVHDATKRRQWRRPDPEEEDEITIEEDLSTLLANSDKNNGFAGNDNNRLSKRRQSMRAMTTNIETSPDRLSRRLSGVSFYDLQQLSQPQYNNERSSHIHTSQTDQVLPFQERLVTQARRASRLMLSTADTNAITDHDRHTISFMARIGKLHKSGYLMKQSKLLGRWRRRFFVLEEQALMYFESEREYEQHAAMQNNSKKRVSLRDTVKADKVFALTGAALASFTTTPRCFSVVIPGHDVTHDASVEWFLLSNTDREMEEWMRAINSHIHVQYLTEQKVNIIEEDYWSHPRGTIGLSLWMVPVSVSSSRRPVGIRTVPMVHGPRTGEGLFPGEVVEVVQIIDEDNAKDHGCGGGTQRYLRLAEDKGWVFEKHPTANYAIMMAAEGSFQVLSPPALFAYNETCLEPLPIYGSPQCKEESRIDGISILPGQQVLAAAVWQVIEQADEFGLAMEQEDEEKVFLRLEAGGWTPLFHPVTGSQLLHRVE